MEVAKGRSDCAVVVGFALHTYRCKFRNEISATSNSSTAACHAPFLFPTAIAYAFGLNHDFFGAPLVVLEAGDGARAQTAYVSNFS